MLDFRGLIQLLEARGELCRIRRPVHPRHEMPALMAQLDGQRRAYIFENVKGARFPLVGGLLNRWEVYGWALGTEPGIPFTASDLARRLESASAEGIAPRVVTNGPVKAQRVEGAAIDLRELPAPTTFELDSGAFITGACGISRNPQTGGLNVGIYRTQILGRDTLTVSANESSDLHGFYAHAARHSGTMPIALAIGVEPALLMAAVCKLPPEQSELGLAGALQGSAIDLMKCETSDLLVPAQAEIVIEGQVDCTRQVENTLGEFVGHYGDDVAPVTQVTAITCRKDALYYSILPGRNPEHNTLASIAGFAFTRAVELGVRSAVPEARDVQVFMEPTLGSMIHVAISLDKRDDAEPMNVIARAFAARIRLAGTEMPVATLTKRIVVVDPDVDVHQLADVEWAIWTRIAAAGKIRVMPDVPSWSLERCAKPDRGSVRLAIDATADMEDRERLRRPVIPGANQIRLADYL